MKLARMKREAVWEGMVGVEVLPASGAVLCCVVVVGVDGRCWGIVVEEP